MICLTLITKLCLWYRITISSRSSTSTSSSAAQVAKLKPILSEKTLDQLRKARARKLKKELLRLDNEIAAAEDAAELAKIKDIFLWSTVMRCCAPAVDVGNIQDFEDDKLIKPRNSEVISTYSTTQVKEQNVVKHIHKTANDE